MAKSPGDRKTDRSRGRQGTASRATGDSRPAEQSRSLRSQSTVPKASPGVPTHPQSVLAPPLPFATLGRYTVLKEIGRGGMGTVYLAEDRILKRQVALKIPQFQPDKAEQMQARFVREAQMAASLSHPHICQVFDVSVIDGQHVMVMEYIEGKTLSDYTKPDRLLPERQAAMVVKKVALAVEAAHQKQMVHRDLKPGNIMLSKMDARRKSLEPKVMDFGLAKSLDGGGIELTKSGMIVGTPCYMSKEQWSARDGQVGPASDVYSLGMILYELLTGRLPYEVHDDEPATAWFVKLVTQEQTPPREHKPSLDPALENIVMSAIAKEPLDRLGSMSAFAMVLTDWLQGRSPVESFFALHEFDNSAEWEVSQKLPPVSRKRSREARSQTSDRDSITDSGIAAVAEQPPGWIRRGISSWFRGLFHAFPSHTIFAGGELGPLSQLFVVLICLSMLFFSMMSYLARTDFSTSRASKSQDPDLTPGITTLESAVVPANVASGPQSEISTSVTSSDAQNSSVNGHSEGHGSELQGNESAISERRVQGFSPTDQAVIHTSNSLSAPAAETSPLPGNSVGPESLSPPVAVDASPNKEPILLKADRVKLNSMFPHSSLQLVWTQEFLRDRPYKQKNAMYIERGIATIRSDGGLWGYNVASLSDNQMIQAKVRIRNSDLGEVGISITQEGNLPGLGVWISGAQRVSTRASLFATVKPRSLNRRFEASEIVRPVEEWNELSCVLKGGMVHVFVNETHIDSAQFTIPPAAKPAAISFTIHSFRPNTIAEMDDCRVFVIR